ncbi:hypothetical protein D8S78_22460 [Natrialba swarupiae]|nr:hypothetical protein [Natrialba swarupiae]
MTDDDLTDDDLTDDELGDDELGDDALGGTWPTTIRPRRTRSTRTRWTNPTRTTGSRSRRRKTTRPRTSSPTPIRRTEVPGRADRRVSAPDEDATADADDPLEADDPFADSETELPRETTWPTSSTTRAQIPTSRAAKRRDRRPAVSRLTSRPDAEILTLELLQYLIEEAGIDGTARTIAYYRSLGWISEPVESYFHRLLNGFTERPVPIDDPNPLVVDDRRAQTEPRVHRCDRNPEKKSSVGTDDASDDRSDRPPRANAATIIATSRTTRTRSNPPLDPPISSNRLPSPIPRRTDCCIRRPHESTASAEEPAEPTTAPDDPLDAAVGSDEPDLESRSDGSADALDIPEDDPTPSSTGDTGADEPIDAAVLDSEPGDILDSDSEDVLEDGVDGAHTDP